MRRTIISLAAALAVPAMFTVLPASFASAATPVIVTCTGFTGSGANSNATGCNHTTLTGGSGSISTSSGGAFTVTWATGKTSTGTSKFTQVSPSTCPSAFPTEVKDVSKVTGGTATALIGGTGKTTLCADSNSNVELLPGTKAKI